MAKSIEVLLSEFEGLQKRCPGDSFVTDVWFNNLESEEQLLLWAAFNESKAREHRYKSACGLVKR